MRSIRGKLWLGMMTLVGVVLLLLWLLQIVWLERFYASMRVNGLQKNLTSLARLTQSSDYQDVVYEMDRLASTQNLTIEWLNADGSAIHSSTGDSGSQMPMMRNMIRADLYRQVLAGEEVQATVSHPRFGTEYTLLGLPLRTAAGSVVGALMTTLPMAAVAETADILKHQLVYVSATLLVVASLCSFWLARGFAKPILEIRRVSAALANGDFSVRTNHQSQDEIGRLAESINHLGTELAKIEQLRRDLVANVSHELRTPLGVIRGYAETIRDITGNNPEQREAQLAIIIEETERLTSLVNDNLHLALLQSGNVELKLRDFCLADLLQDVVERYLLIAEQKGVKLLLRGEGEARVVADEAKLEQVVRNLLQSSLQHTALEGQVVIEVVENADSVRVAVADTGAGIPAADLPHIWDKFHRGTTASAGTIRGTGLGLAIVKGILDAHGAEYGVDSEVGVGTTVWFKLKRASS